MCGLRTRSEIAELRWQHINWQAGTFTVPKVKTDERIVPIFGDFRQVLEDYHELTISQQPDVQPTDLMFPKCPSQTQLTNRLKRTAKRAGLQPWAKPWMNLRSSVETYLVRKGGDIETVAKWLGNSPDVARKHYLQVTPKHIEWAAEIGSEKKSAHSPHIDAKKTPLTGMVESETSAES